MVIPDPRQNQYPNSPIGSSSRSRHHNLRQRASDLNRKDSCRRHIHHHSHHHPYSCKSSSSASRIKSDYPQFRYPYFDCSSDSNYEDEMAITTYASNPQDPEANLKQNRHDLKKKQRYHENEYDRGFKKTNNRLYMYVRSRMNASSVSMVFMATILTTLIVHRISSTIMSRKKWINAPITYMQRQCPAFDYEPMSPEQAENLKICITTLTDNKSPSWFQRFIRWRNYDGIIELTWPNKKTYAEKHGYHLFDQSHLIDTSRPPAWSKIKAVQDLFSEEHNCDWVVWTDADTVIMNLDVKITDFLPGDDRYDMLVASDKGGGWNSGVFMFRNTEWSKQFLDDWWNMKSFVRPPGFSLSGDNAAMKHFLAHMPDFDDHVLSPPRCTFNSFAKFLTLSQSLAVMDNLEEQDWYMDDNHYHKGDFIAHTPGIDNKAEALRLLLEEAKKYNSL